MPGGFPVTLVARPFVHVAFWRELVPRLPLLASSGIALLGLLWRPEAAPDVLPVLLSEAPAPDASGGLLEPQVVSIAMHRCGWVGGWGVWVGCADGWRVG